MLLGFLLPLGVGFLAFDLFRRLWPSVGLREIILMEAIALGVAVVVSTEMLNLAHALTSWGVLGWWALGGFALHYYRVRLPRAEPLRIRSRFSAFFRETSFEALGLVFAIMVFTLALLLVGLVATPNNYDSMTYHLARVAHWAQDQSISFYGTNIPRQNFMPPWAEWVMLQLTLLEGDDRLVNLVQGSCYVGCMLGAAVITERLGGSRRDGIIAAFFVATLPEATFEATSTQNDLVMSFWLICAVYGCVKLSRNADWLATCIFGASLGLAMLTKTVTMIFAAPLCLWVVWVVARRDLGKAVPRLAVISLLALGLNAGHAARNFATSGHALGPDEHDQVGSHYLNDVHGPGAIFSNVLRNLSLHANLFHEKSVAEEAVIRLHRALGLDPNDPRTTFNGGVYSIWEGGEDGSPMPLHLLVIAVSFIALAGKQRRFGFPPLALGGSVLTGAFLFCLMLKWQPFHARLHLALFIMSAPLAGLVLGSMFRRMISLPILVLFLLTAIPNVFWYFPRAALGPLSVFVTSTEFQQLFRQPQLAGPYEEAKEILEQNKVQEVGLICHEDDWEYPLLISDRVPVSWRVDHVLIDNAYAPLETTLVPDALLCTRPGLGEIVTVHGQRYRLARAYVRGRAQNLVLSIYFPENASVSLPR
jgi:hypothetical protein